MKAVDVLDRVDWNFPQAGTDNRSVHSTHWFPGNFIPQIRTAFIQALSKPGDVIFDPFGGSGTTGLEALRLGRRAIISDRISACALISRGKVDLHSALFAEPIRQQVLAKLMWRNLCHSERIGSHREGSDERLLDCFAPGTLGQLRYIWQLVEAAESTELRNALLVLFSDLLFACASPGRATTSTGKRRRHHWGWVADNVRPKRLVEHNAVELFEARLMSLPDRPQVRHPERILVLQEDVRQLALPPNSVDLIVTSPPYIGVIDYVRANRLLYMWMGWSLEEEGNGEIGARFKRKRAQTLRDYLADMETAWTEIARVLRPGGHLAIVIGESRRYPGAAQESLRCLSRFMSQTWGPRVRSASRRRVSDRGANRAIEYLHVFRKE
jgi:DNA methylase